MSKTSLLVLLSCLICGIFSLVFFLESVNAQHNNNPEVTLYTNSTCGGVLNGRGLEEGNGALGGGTHVCIYDADANQLLQDFNTGGGSHEFSIPAGNIPGGIYDGRRFLIYGVDADHSNGSNVNTFGGCQNRAGGNGICETATITTGQNNLSTSCPNPFGAGIASRNIMRMSCTGGPLTPTPTPTPIPPLGCTPVNTFPNPVNTTCANPGTVLDISWTADPNASFYSIRLDNTNDPWGGITDPINCSSPGGDTCIDVPAGATTHQFTGLDPNATYVWWIHSRDDCTPAGFGPGVFGQAMKCAPNCYMTGGPSILNVGTPGNYSAYYQSLDGQLSGELFRDNAMSGATSIPGIEGTLNYSWTPTAADVGVHNLCCRAWNDGKAECLPGSLVSQPAQYACISGPSTCMAVTVSNIQEWFKLRDTSFHKLGNLTMTLPNAVTPYDTDDTTAIYPLIGRSGMGSASGTMTINSTNATISSRGWERAGFADDNNFLNNIPSFIEYARARKKSKIITAINQIEANTINIYNGNLTLTNIQLPALANYILIVNGNLQIAENIPNVPAPFNSANRSIGFMVSGTLNISSNINQMSGIYIAQRVNLAQGMAPGVNSIVPLKLNGNLLSNTAINALGRENPDITKPSFFVVFKPQMYFDLLPLLSTIVQEGRQIQ